MTPPPGSVNARLQAAQGYLGLGMAMDAWDELENIDAKHRANPRVLKVRLEVARALAAWEIVVEVARHLAKLEPDNALHVVNLAEAERHVHGPEAAFAVLEWAIDTRPDHAPLRFNLAVELARAGRPADARRVLRVAFKLDPKLRAPALDHPELAAVIDCEDVD
jgi:Flp pilus assembly protein TadD